MGEATRRSVSVVETPRPAWIQEVTTRRATPMATVVPGRVEVDRLGGEARCSLGPQALNGRPDGPTTGSAACRGGCGSCAQATNPTSCPRLITSSDASLVRFDG